MKKLLGLLGLLVAGLAQAQTVPISGLPAATTSLNGVEVFPVVQSSTTKKMTLAQMQSFLEFAPNTWTGITSFQGGGSITTGLSQVMPFVQSTAPGDAAIVLVDALNATDQKTWVIANSANVFGILAPNDADSAANSALQFLRSGDNITGVTVGNATNLPAITLDGPVTIPSPGSGAALTATAVGSVVGSFIGGNTSTGGAILLTDGHTGAQSYQVGVGITTASHFQVYDAVAGLTRFDLSNTGHSFFSAPSVGTTLNVFGSSSGNALEVTSGNSALTAFADLYITRAGSTMGNFLEGPSIQLNDSTAGTATALQHSGGQTELWQYNSGWNQIWEILPTRGMVVQVPASGIAFTAVGVGGSNVGWAAQFASNSTTAGQSNGVLITAGVGSSGDRVLDVLSQSGTTRYLGVFGTGVVLGNPTGALQGLGTLNSTGLFVNGVAVCQSTGTNCPSTVQTTGTVTLAYTSGCTTGTATASGTYVVTGVAVTLHITSTTPCTTATAGATIVYNGLPAATLPASTVLVPVVMTATSLPVPAACSVGSSGSVSCSQQIGTTAVQGLALTAMSYSLN